MDDVGSIRLGENEIFYRVERRRIRNSYLKFVGSELRIIIPKYSLARTDKLIDEHLPWIARQYEKSKKVIWLFEYGSNKLFYGGKQYYVAFSASQARPKVEVYPDVIRVTAKDVNTAERAIERFIKEETYRLVSDKSKAIASAIGEEIKEVNVRRSRKWGSCSSRHVITFNTYLSMLPPELLDYVVAHEVAHLKEMNHSTAFWHTVEFICPDYRERRRKLRYYENTRKRVIATLPNAQ